MGALQFPVGIDKTKSLTSRYEVQYEVTKMGVQKFWKFVWANQSILLFKWDFFQKLTKGAKSSKVIVELGVVAPKVRWAIEMSVKHLVEKNPA